MNNSQKKVCMISTLHGMCDDRIYWKEAVSLQKNGYNLSHICVGSDSLDFISPERIRIIQLFQQRYFKNPYLDIFFRLITFKKSIALKLYKIAAKLQADVYHLHDVQLNKIGRKLKNLPHKPKVIYDVHEPYPEIARYLNNSKGIVRLLRVLQSVYIYKWQISCAQYYDAIIATEENVANYFIKYLGEEKVRIIYNYCDFDVSVFNKGKSKKYDLIYIGGISQWRGIYELLHTAILARDSGLKLKILFIGPVKEIGLKEKILKTIKSEHLEEIFFLEVPVERTELIKYLKASKIGICIFADNPVYKIIMPIKIFEYMAAGLPVLCNNFGHAFKIVSKENIGIGINDVSPEKILEAVMKILNDNNYYNQLSDNALNAIKKYSWKNMEKVLFKTYSELLS